MTRWRGTDPLIQTSRGKRAHLIQREITRRRKHPVRDTRRVIRGYGSTVFARQAWLLAQIARALYDVGKALAPDTRDQQTGQGCVHQRCPV